MGKYPMIKWFRHLGQLYIVAV